jgi:hypothetical protein
VFDLDTVLQQDIANAGAAIGLDDRAFRADFLVG